MQTCMHAKIAIQDAFVLFSIACVYDPVYMHENCPLYLILYQLDIHCYMYIRQNFFIVKIHTQEDSLLFK